MDKYDEKKCSDIKKIVKSNFDLSLKEYETFEKKRALFKTLTNALSSFCGIQKGMKVVDIGAGSGISTYELAKHAGRSGFVYGIDISPVMLNYAEKCRGKSNIKYICGSASELGELLKENLDIALYSASIFLIPDIEKSLDETCKILKKDGSMGASYLKGIYIDDKTDLFDEIRKKTKIPVSEKRVLHSEDFVESSIKKYFPFVEKTKWSYRMKLSDFKAFYSIEAPLASIFPKHTYSERLIKITETVKVVQDRKISEMEMKWILFKGRKTDEIF